MVFLTRHTVLFHFCFNSPLFERPKIIKEKEKKKEKRKKSGKMYAKYQKFMK